MRFATEKKINERSVLFIDDDDMVAAPYIKFLKQFGLEVIYISNGVECEAFLDQNKVSLVVVDLVMPYFDGIEVTKLIRKKLSKDELPIIMLSSKKNEFDIEMASINGVNKFINKLEGPRVLLDSCNELLKKR